MSFFEDNQAKDSGGPGSAFDGLLGDLLGHWDEDSLEEAEALDASPPPDIVIEETAGQTVQPAPQPPIEVESSLAFLSARQPQVQPECSPLIQDTALPRRRKSAQLLEIVQTLYLKIQERRSGKADMARDGFVTFRLSGASYGFPIGSVLEVNRIPRLTPAPMVPAYVGGLFNFRGQVLPLIDLRVLLGLEEESNGRMIVLQPPSGDSPAAFAIDALSGIVWLHSDEITCLEPDGQPLSAILSAQAIHRGARLGIVGLDMLFKLDAWKQLDTIAGRGTSPAAETSGEYPI